MFTTQSCLHASKSNLSMPRCVANRLSMILLCTLPCKNSHNNGIHCNMESEYTIILMYWTKKKTYIGKFLRYWFFLFWQIILLLIYQNQHKKLIISLLIMWSDVKPQMVISKWWEWTFMSCNWEFHGIFHEDFK